MIVSMDANRLADWTARRAGARHGPLPPVASYSAGLPGAICRIADTPATAATTTASEKAATAAKKAQLDHRYMARIRCAALRITLSLSSKSSWN